MKHLILCIYKEALKYKGHRNALNQLAVDIAQFNGGAAVCKDFDEFNNLISRYYTDEHDFEFYIKDETTVEFGHTKTDKKFVPYGKIIKTVLI